MSEEKQFEINKHLASVIRAHFGWISCHTSSQGCVYRDKEDREGQMTSAQLLLVGATLELKKVGNC